MRIMKYIVKIVTAVVLTALSVSCSMVCESGDMNTGAYTYKMRFDCCLNGSGYAETKAGYVWKDGTKVCVQFESNNSLIKGVATYNGNTDEWMVETDKILSAATDAHCEVYWFDGLTDYSAESLIIGPNVPSFNDIDAKYTLFGDDILMVSARLTPMTSRLRFVGEPGRTFRVDGLKYCSIYSIISNTITMNSERLTVSIGEDGSSDYFYVVFAELKERQLNVEGEYNTAFVRTFSNDVLEIGASGFITVPDFTNMGKWTLVNTENYQEILLPQVSETVVSDVKGTVARVSAQVTDNGNGMLLTSGFVYSKSENPTLETALDCPCNPSEISDARLTGLEKLTTYFVRAYVSNPKGLTYGEETIFTTTDEDPDVGDFDDVMKDDWSDEEDWGVGENTGEEDDVTKDDWTGDEDWSVGENTGEEDDIMKDDWSEDEDWNGEE